MLFLSVPWIKYHTRIHVKFCMTYEQNKYSLAHECIFIFHFKIVKERSTI